MTTQEKFQELVKIRREFQKPVVKKHSVIIRPREWVVDDKKAGGVRANSSTVELKVNGDSIGIFHLNGGFGSYHVELPEGTNTLEFVAKIVAHSGQINDSCMVNFDVKGPAEYYPRIVLDRRVVRDCSPKAVCRSRRAQAGHKAVKSAVHSS